MRGTGLFDLQVNGYAGVDFNSTALTADALDHALEMMRSSGVTSCLPTLITAPEDVLAARFAALDAAVANSRFGPAMVPGYHLEGPFLNPTPGYAGCHPAAAMVLPDAALVERVSRGLRRQILLMTIAPERAGALPLIAWAKGRGITVAMGHTAAEADDVASAADAGVVLSTHLGNALPQPQPKFLNPLIAQLAEDRLHASFIADGIHIPQAALKVLLRAKGLGRSPVLAGSGLALDQAVRNIVAWGFASAPEAMAMASTAPAALLGLTLPRTEVAWDAELRPTIIGDAVPPRPARPRRR
jgi:N-acetylglucosamine-6-phosphate deacetylase